MFGFGKPNVPKMVERQDIVGLIKALSYPKDEQVRTAAGDALVAMGAPAVTPLIRSLGESSHDFDAAIAALLARIGQPAVESLIFALGSGSARTCSYAARALGRIRDPRAIAPLIGMMQRWATEPRLFAREALASIGQPAVEPLIAALSGEGHNEEIGQALAQIGAPAVEPLMAVLRSDYRELVWPATYVLGMFKDPHAVEALGAELDSENHLIRARAESALKAIGTPQARELLAAASRRQATPVPAGQPAAPSTPSAAGPKKVTGSVFDAIDRGQPDLALQYIEDGADVNAGLSSGDTPLHVASFKGYAEVVKRLIEKGADVHATITRGDPGATPLHLAAMKGHVEVITILLAHGANSRARLGGSQRTSTSGALPLHLAATHNQMQAVKVLIAQGADPNAVDDYGDTPLHYAANKGLREMARLLVDLGANPNAVDNYGRTPRSLG